jgi:hypothetical protein
MPRGTLQLLLQKCGLYRIEDKGPPLPAQATKGQSFAHFVHSFSASITDRTGSRVGRPDPCTWVGRLTETGDEETRRIFAGKGTARDN